MTELKPNWAPTELDSAATDVISEISKEFDSSNLQTSIDSISTDNTEATPSDQTPTQDQIKETAPEATPPTPENKGVEDGLARLVEREVAIRGREEAIQSKEREYSQLQERIKHLESRGLPDNVLEQLKLRPTDTLKAIGVDPDSLIRIAIAEKMRADGKEVPAELRSAIDKADSQRELQELRARLEAKDRAEQARAYYDQVNMGAREWLGQETNLKDTQSVASAFKKDADFVHREIMSIIASDASRKGPNEKHLSYAEAAKIADKHWTKLKSILSDDNSAQPQGSKQAIPTKANVSGGPPTRPPEKPMAPWLQRHALAEEGVKAALQEFQRVEGLNGIRK